MIGARKPQRVGQTRTTSHHHQRYKTASPSPETRIYKIVVARFGPGKFAKTTSISQRTYFQIVNMQFTSLRVALLALIAVGASAATHKVEVGKGGLKYTPDTITAAKGDIIEFHFDSEHTVTAGDFSKPCTPATSGGFYSGDLPAKGNVSLHSLTTMSALVFLRPRLIHPSLVILLNHCQQH